MISPDTFREFMARATRGMPSVADFVGTMLWIYLCYWVLQWTSQ